MSGKQIPQRFQNLKQLADSNPLYLLRVVEGFDIDYGAGLDFTLDAGTLGIGTERIYIPNLTFTCATNSDIYIYGDYVSQQLHLITVDNGDPLPVTIESHWYLLHACSTDGTTFSDALDMREYRIFANNVIHAYNISSDAVASPITISSGQISHATSGVTPGSYTNSNITVNSTGHITTISNGSGGTGSGGPDFLLMGA